MDEVGIWEKRQKIRGSAELNCEIASACYAVGIHQRLFITGLGALSALGTDLEAHVRAVRGQQVPFRPLGDLLGLDSPHAKRPGAWIEPRKLLTHRKWSPVTMAALHVAREAIEAAGWGSDLFRWSGHRR